MTIKLPDFLKERLLQDKCPVHGEQLLLIDGKKMCKQCQLIKSKKHYAELTKERMKALNETLDEQKRQKQEAIDKKKSNLEKSGGDVVKRTFGAKWPK